MLLAKNDEVVETLVLKRLAPAFGIAVEIWAGVWKPDDICAARLQDGIELLGELLVAVTDEMACLHAGLLQMDGKVPGLLRHPLCMRMVGDPRDEDSPASDVDEE